MIVKIETEGEAKALSALPRVNGPIEVGKEYHLGMVKETATTKEHGERKNPGIVSNRKGASFGLNNIGDGLRAFLVIKPVSENKPSADAETL